MLTKFKHHFSKPVNFVARQFIKVGLSANAVTVLGLVLGISLSVYLVISENYVAFGIGMVFCGLLDAVDGAIARVNVSQSRFGSYLDAMCDRIFDFTGCFAVAYVSGKWALFYVVICGAFLISYAKARASMETSISNDGWPDLMERTERDLGLVLIVILYGLFPEATVLSLDLLTFGLVILIVLIFATVVQRILRATILLRN